MIDRKKVLVLDPSPIFRRALKEVIQTIETHVDVVEAGDTEQAETILRTESPDVVFIDIAIPGYNGVAFIASVKALVPDSRIVVLTSRDSDEYQDASLENGADYFLSKEQTGGLRLMDVIRETIRRKDTR